MTEAEQELEQAKHLIRYLAAAWDGANTWIWENAAGLDAIMEYPIVQGTSHQLKLGRIGEQSYDLVKVGEGVKMMLTDKPDRNEG